MYKLALRGDPNNPQVLSELARIQTYSSSLLRNDTEKLARLKEAVASADKAVQVAPDDSQIHAIRAFVLDWYSSNPLVSDNEREQALNEANSEANRAFQLDPNNALALAYYAEILTDQQKWSQALTYARKAVDLDPNSMDTHRVLGYVYENRGDYNFAIREYQAATQINPNMTFLYVLIGRLYREGIKNPDLASGEFRPGCEYQQDLERPEPGTLCRDRPHLLAAGPILCGGAQCRGGLAPGPRQRLNLRAARHHLHPGAELRRGDGPAEMHGGRLYC